MPRSPTTAGTAHIPPFGVMSRMLDDNKTSPGLHGRYPPSGSRQVILLPNLDVTAPVIGGIRRMRLRGLGDDESALPEMARLTIKQPQAQRKSLAVRLRSHDAWNVRFYGSNGGSDLEQVLGPRAGSAEPPAHYPVPTGNGRTELRGEAVTLRGAPSLMAARPSLQSGTSLDPYLGTELEIALVHEDPAGESVDTASERLTIAPCLLLSNLQPVERIYVTYLRDDTEDIPGSHPFIADLAECLRDIFRGQPDPVGTISVSGEHIEWTHGDTGLLEIIDSARYNDIWVQDAFELGYCRAPQGWTHIAVQSPRAEPLHAWVRDELPGPALGLFAELAEQQPMDSIEYAGNLEVSQAVTIETGELDAGLAGDAVPKHPRAPFGKILLGEGRLFAFALPPALTPDRIEAQREELAEAFAANRFALEPSWQISPGPNSEEWYVTDTPRGYTGLRRTFQIRADDGRLLVHYVRSIPGPARRFLEAQGIQPTLPLDVSWLNTGHVDEVMTLVPSADNGFRMVMASSKLALDLLDAAQTVAASDPDVLLTDMFRGRPDLNSRLKIRDARMTITEVLTETERTNRDIHFKKLIPIEQRLVDGLNLDDNAIVHLPVLFEALPEVPSKRLGMVTSDRAGAVTIVRTTAKTPNLVNMLVLGTDLILPRPEGPRMNRTGVVRALARMTTEPLPPHFLEALEDHWYWAERGRTLAWLASTFGVTPEIIARDPANRHVFEKTNATRDRWTRIRIPEDGIDLFEAYTVATLRPLGLRPRFVDAWSPYHIAEGGVHCATNVMRLPPEAAEGYQGTEWWDEESS